MGPRSARTRPHWLRVFAITEADVDRLWDVIGAAAITSPAARSRPGPWGVGCDIGPMRTFNVRSARVLIAWHYADANAELSDQAPVPSVTGPVAGADLRSDRGVHRGGNGRRRRHLNAVLALMLAAAPRAGCVTGRTRNG
jgi:hypothetical protein